MQSIPFWSQKRNQLLFKLFSNNSRLCHVPRHTYIRADISRPDNFIRDCGQKFAMRSMPIIATDIISLSVPKAFFTSCQSDINSLTLKKESVNPGRVRRLGNAKELREFKN